MRHRWIALWVSLLLLVACAAPPAPLPAESAPEVQAASGPQVIPPATGAPRDEPDPPPVDYAAAAQQLSPRIAAICKEASVTGMSLAVFDANGIVYRQSYGYAVVENGTPATQNTRFRIASVSKAVTAMLALRLVEQGRLTLDDDLSPLVGYQLRNPRYPDSPITLRQLLTHTAGLEDSGLYWDAVAISPLPAPSRVVPYSFGTSPPGDRYCYTNLGMGLVSGVIEGATGTRFLDYTRQQVFAPRDVDAAYSYTDISDVDSAANIYQGGSRTVNLRDWRGMTAKYDKLPIGQLYAVGQAELIITADDLADIARAMSGHPRPDDPLGLGPDTLQLLNTVQYEQTDTAAYVVDEIKRGLGTHITDHLVEGRQMVGHQGNAYGCICAMFWDPQTGTGFVMLTNGASAASNSSGIYKLFVNVGNTVYDAFFCS